MSTSSTGASTLRPPSSSGSLMIRGTWWKTVKYAIFRNENVVRIQFYTGIEYCWKCMLCHEKPLMRIWLEKCLIIYRRWTILNCYLILQMTAPVTSCCLYCIKIICLEDKVSDEGSRGWWFKTHWIKKNIFDGIKLSIFGNKTLKNFGKVSCQFKFDRQRYSIRLVIGPSVLSMVQTICCYLKMWWKIQDVPLPTRNYIKKETYWLFVNLRFSFTVNDTGTKKFAICVVFDRTHCPKDPLYALCLQNEFRSDVK